jgi:hypothetical protein
MRVQEWMPRLLGFGAMAIALSSTGCKSLNERYISLEVWKYEKCFGHLPPGFVPPGAMAQAAAARRPLRALLSSRTQRALWTSAPP